MCEHCGCGIVGDVTIGDGQTTRIHHPDDHDHPHPHDHGHPHPHDHPHDHSHPPVASRTVDVQESVLAKNDRLAERNRGYFEATGVLVVNVLSSPGAGKTTLLERTAADLDGRLRLGVIVGDLETDNDARRLRGRGLPAVQVTTGTVCHLDAEMVSRAKDRLDMSALDVLIIENVGNLVCPASYDLGEALRIVVMSVTEGEDKPLKYPLIFKTAHAVLISKTDLAAAAGFDREAALGNLRRVAPQARILEVSARSGAGLEDWYRLLEASRPARGRTGSAAASSA
jgi:hydrogenase nickel incorporation protein HypB